MNETNLYNDLPLFLVGGTAIVVIFFAIVAAYKLFNLMVRIKEVEIYEKHGLDKYLSEKEANEGSWWSRFIRQVNDAVPVEKEKDILLDHDYDGIKELDNNLPPWWLYGFYLTIAIGIFYMAYYHLRGDAKNSQELYEIEMVEAQEAVDEYISKQANKVDENSVIALVDEQSLLVGQEIFKTNCAACHLEHGGGNATSVGPNLTDDYWLHGGGIKNVFTTVKYGVPEKGMISWKDQLRPSDIQHVASYILSLKGTNPAGAKDPQGELYIIDDVILSDSTGIDSLTN